MTVAASFGKYIPKSQWQHKCGFIVDPEDVHIFPSIPVTEQTPIQGNDQDPRPIITDTNKRHPQHTIDATSHNWTEDPIEGIIDSDVPHADTNIISTEGDQARPPPEPNETRTRYGRISRNPKRYHEYVSYVIWITAKTYQASNDPDTLYYHEAINEPDAASFIHEMEEEIRQHNDNKNWIAIPRSEIPKGHRVLPSVWSMRRKRDLTTGIVLKYKYHLNVDGSKQQKGMDYVETFAPVATWCSIRLILLMACVMDWHTYQLDFVQAFPQAPVEKELYIEVPKGCSASDNKKYYVMKVLNNISGKKQAGKVWYDYLIIGLTKRLNFTQSRIDPCVLWRRTCILVIYTDDTS